MLNARRDNNTPEEVRTFKEIKLFNFLSVEVLFFFILTSSSSTISPNVTSFLKCIASEVLQKDMILD